MTEKWKGDINRLVSAPLRVAGCWTLPFEAHSDPKFSFGFDSFIWVITWRSQGSLFVHQLQVWQPRFPHVYNSRAVPWQLCKRPTSTATQDCQKQEATRAHRMAHPGLGFRHALGLVTLNDLSFSITREVTAWQILKIEFHIWRFSEGSLYSKKWKMKQSLGSRASTCGRVCLIPLKSVKAVFRFLH